MIKKLVGAALLTASAMATPAHAVVFNLINIGGAEKGTQARLAFEVAANYWSKVLTNNSTVNLQIGFSALRPGVLGSTGSTAAEVAVRDVALQMLATGNSQLDRIATNSVVGQLNFATGAVSAITNGPATAGNLGVNTATLEWDNDNSDNNKLLYVNTANLKALGITTDAYGASVENKIDGRVSFSTNYAFDFNPADGIDADKTDFVGVAIHEIGHALGFVSGVDFYDVYGRASGAGASVGDTIDWDRSGGWMSALDLFRYSRDVTGVAPGTGPVLDWSVTTVPVLNQLGRPYFSIDGGQTQLFGGNSSRFSTGRFNGDGYQASHWRASGTCVNFIGIMNPYLCDTSESFVTAVDLGAFDAIGYNVNIDVLNNSQYNYSSGMAYLAYVPEPATWAQMILGFGLVGGMFRARRRAVAA